MAVFDYSPQGWREWFISSYRYDTGDMNVCDVIANQALTGVIGVTVMEATIPFTFYVINKYNNLLRMRERAIGGANPLPSDPYITVTITPGNYSANTIGTALLSAFTTAGLTGTYTVNYSDASGKLTISSSNRQFDLLFTNKSSDKICTLPIGFDAFVQPNIINVSSVVTPNAISLSGPSFIFLRGTLGVGSGDNMVVCDDGEQRNMGNILAAIPVNAVPGASITWRNPAPRGGMFGISADVLRNGTFW